MEYCGGGSLQDIYHGELYITSKMQCSHKVVLNTVQTLLNDSSANIKCNRVVIVTGPLSEIQIAYVCRETIQVI